MILEDIADNPTLLLGLNRTRVSHAP